MQHAIPVNSEIHLSALRPKDKPALVEFLNEREISKRTLRIPFPYTEADAEAFLQIDAQATEARGHPVHFAIRDPSERLLGCCGFEGIVPGHRAEIGYWLAKPYWGRGIMTEVVRAASETAMTKWNLVRITAHVFPFNQASARVLEKTGFQFEGLLRKHHRKEGKFLDAELYALVKGCCQTFCKAMQRPVDEIPTPRTLPSKQTSMKNPPRRNQAPRKNQSPRRRAGKPTGQQEPTSMKTPPIPPEPDSTKKPHR